MATKKKKRLMDVDLSTDSSNSSPDSRPLSPARSVSEAGLPQAQRNSQRQEVLGINNGARGFLTFATQEDKEKVVPKGMPPRKSRSAASVKERSSPSESPHSDCDPDSEKSKSKENNSKEREKGKQSEKAKGKERRSSVAEKSGREKRVSADGAQRAKKRSATTTTQKGNPGERKAAGYAHLASSEASLSSTSNTRRGSVEVTKLAHWMTSYANERRGSVFATESPQGRGSRGRVYDEDMCGDDDCDLAATTPIFRLSVRLLSRIFSYLQFEDHVALSCVCYKFLRASTGRALIGRILSSPSFEHLDTLKSKKYSFSSYLFHHNRLVAADDKRLHLLDQNMVQLSEKLPAWSSASPCGWRKYIVTSDSTYLRLWTPEAVVNKQKNVGKKVALMKPWGGHLAVVYQGESVITELDERFQEKQLYSGHKLAITELYHWYNPKYVDGVIVSVSKGCMCSHRLGEKFHLLRAKSHLTPSYIRGWGRKLVVLYKENTIRVYKGTEVRHTITLDKPPTGGLCVWRDLLCVPTKTGVRLWDDEGKEKSPIYSEKEKDKPTCLLDWRGYLCVGTALGGVYIYDRLGAHHVCTFSTGSAVRSFVPLSISSEAVSCLGCELPDQDWWNGGIVTVHGSLLKVWRPKGERRQTAEVGVIPLNALSALS